MKVKIRKEMLIYIAFLCITLSWASFFVNKGVGNILEYIGLICILFAIYFRKYEKRDIKRITLLIVVFFFFSIGLIVQELDTPIKIKAILSMFILSSIAVMPCQHIKKFVFYLGIERFIIAGLIISTSLSLISGYSILTPASEGLIFKFGFNAGIVHRNYFAYILLCLFINEYVRFKLEFINNKRNLVVISILIATTNSRSCLILLFLFLTISNIDKIHISNYKGTVIFVVFCIILILIGTPMYEFLKDRSETFFFRLNGLYNYLNMFSSNVEYMLFGNLRIAHGIPYMSYDENIKSVIGWNGSTELVIFNVLVKNGLFGFAGYFFILQNYFISASKVKNENLKMIIFATITCFIVSAFVESYVANINHLFTVYIYLFLNNISTINLNAQKASCII